MLPPQREAAAASVSDRGAMLEGDVRVTFTSPSNICHGSVATACYPQDQLVLLPTPPVLEVGNPQGIDEDLEGVLHRDLIDIDVHRKGHRDRGGHHDLHIG